VLLNWIVKFGNALITVTFGFDVVTLVDDRVEPNREQLLALFIEENGYSPYGDSYGEQAPAVWLDRIWELWKDGVDGGLRLADA